MTNLKFVPHECENRYIIEVWLVDIKQQCLQVYRQPTPTGYGQVQKFQEGKGLSIQRFPGMNIQVDDILGRSVRKHGK